MTSIKARKLSPCFITRRMLWCALILLVYYGQSGEGTGAGNSTNTTTELPTSTIQRNNDSATTSRPNTPTTVATTVLPSTTTTVPHTTTTTAYPCSTAQAPVIPQVCDPDPNITTVYYTAFEGLFAIRFCSVNVVNVTFTKDNVSRPYCVNGICGEEVCHHTHDLFPDCHILQSGVLVFTDVYTQHDGVYSSPSCNQKHQFLYVKPLRRQATVTTAMTFHGVHLDKVNILFESYKEWDNKLYIIKKNGIWLNMKPWQQYFSYIDNSTVMYVADQDQDGTYFFVNQDDPTDLLVYKLVVLRDISFDNITLDTLVTLTTHYWPGVDCSNVRVTYQCMIEQDRGLAYSNGLGGEIRWSEIQKDEEAYFTWEHTGDMEGAEMNIQLHCCIHNHLMKRCTEKEYIEDIIRGYEPSCVYSKNFCRGGTYDANGYVVALFILILLMLCFLLYIWFKPVTKSCIPQSLYNPLPVSIELNASEV